MTAVDAVDGQIAEAGVPIAVDVTAAVGPGRDSNGVLQGLAAVRRRNGRIADIAAGIPGRRAGHSSFLKC